VGRTSNISQRATTPTSAALSGRKRSEPSRAALRNTLSAEPVVARIVGAGGASANAGTVGEASSAGGGAGSVAADSMRCDRSDIDTRVACATAAGTVGSDDCDSVSTARLVGSSTCRNGAGKVDLP